MVFLEAWSLFINLFSFDNALVALCLLFKCLLDAEANQIPIQVSHRNSKPERISIQYGGSLPSKDSLGIAISVRQRVDRITAVKQLYL